MGTLVYPNLQWQRWRSCGKTKSCLPTAAPSWQGRTLRAMGLALRREGNEKAEQLLHGHTAAL